MNDLEALYRRYAPDVHRFSFWLSGNAADADDLTSETFVRAWAGTGSIRVETAKAYLLTIARNIYLQRQRRSRRETELDPELVDRTVGAEARVEVQSELAAALAGLQELPEVDRAALLMRAEHELPYDEIARALGIQPTAAKVKVHRARVRLRKRREKERSS